MLLTSVSLLCPLCTGAGSSRSPWRATATCTSSPSATRSFSSSHTCGSTLKLVALAILRQLSVRISIFLQVSPAAPTLGPDAEGRGVSHDEQVFELRSSAREPGQSRREERYLLFYVVVGIFFKFLRLSCTLGWKMCLFVSVCPRKCRFGCVAILRDVDAGLLVGKSASGFQTPQGGWR